MHTLTMLALLDGEHRIVTTDVVKAGDLIILGQCVRRLHRYSHTFMDYEVWDVQDPLTEQVVGTWQVRRSSSHLVIRPRES